MRGIDLIAAERHRQIEEEGWTAQHDDAHADGELARAAACYALQGATYFDRFRFWPWNEGWWKPTADPIRDLTKAGALIAAEIDRLLREEDEDA